MKKVLYFSIAVLVLLTTACTKKNEGVKAEIEKTLPSIELTSMGLATQMGPFTTKDILEVTYGGALTNNEAGTFDFAWYDEKNNARVDSVHLASWNVETSAATANNGINVSWGASTYPNTKTFTGNLLLSLAKLAAGKSYSLRLYARGSDNNVGSVSTSKFITMK